MTPFLAAAVEQLYGEQRATCATCGWPFGATVEEARSVVAAAPARVSEALRSGADHPVPAGSWTPVGYCWHLVDFLRSWAERFVALHAGDGPVLVGWDPDELAAVRGYDRLPASSALWALDGATRDLLDAAALAGASATFTHADWGRGDVADALRWAAHEVVHHEHDVRRLRGGAGAAEG